MSETEEFAGKVALVTGSTSGIGEEVARRLASAGASVMLNSATSVEPGRALAAELGDRVDYHQCDISDHEACEAMIAATVERFGRLDILVNNAGWTTVVPHGDLAGVTDEILFRTFEVNVYGTWWLSKAAMPHLRESDDGNIVNITSIAGVRPVGSSIAYSMSKAALNQLTQLLAKSCGPVRVNAVAPGLVATPWTADWDTQHAQVAKIAPVPRSATPADCAEATLACLRTTYMTGNITVVDGGITMVS
ncbi:MAG: SDR family oxidoreductase [Actinomycetia bacterium]|nr:SDR family oxidoreductase [Actinomycetes bacterium]